MKKNELPAQKIDHRLSRKKNTAERNNKIKARFSELYEKKRMRLDDVISQLAEEFCLSPLTIERIISK